MEIPGLISLLKLFISIKELILIPQLIHDSDVWSQSWFRYRSKLRFPPPFRFRSQFRSRNHGIDFRIGIGSVERLRSSDSRSEKKTSDSTTPSLDQSGSLWISPDQSGSVRISPDQSRSVRISSDGSGSIQMSLFESGWVVSDGGIKTVRLFFYFLLSFWEAYGTREKVFKSDGKGKYYYKKENCYTVSYILDALPESQWNH